MSYHRARVGSDKGNARGEHRRIWRFWLQVGIWEGGGENQREESTHQSPERVQNLLRVWQGGILEDVGGIQWHTTTVRAIHTQPKKHACGHAVQHTLLHRRTHKDSLSLSLSSLSSVPPWWFFELIGSNTHACVHVFLRSRSTAHVASVW